MALTNKLSAIGDAIRAKTGKSDLLTLEQMPVEIAAIQGGGSGGTTGFAAYLNGETTTLYDDTVTSVRQYAFYNGTNNSTYTPIRIVDFPNVITINQYAFTNQYFITKFNFPKLQTLGERSCMYCKAVTEIVLPEVRTIGQYAFFCNSSNIGKLKKIDLGKVTNIAAYAFQYHSSLETLIIRSDSVCTLANTNALSNTGSRYIYVPAALVDSYKSATNWSSFKSYIRAIEDYPEICGEVA